MTGILSTKHPQPLEPPTRIPDEPLGGENIYETHEVDMGIINDFGEVFPPLPSRNNKYCP